MISAKEAKALVEESETTCIDYIEKHFTNQIYEKATQGKQEYIHFLDCIEEFNKLPNLTPVLQKVIKKLSDLGYLVKYEAYGDTYIPRGLEGDYGDGPVHQNYGIIVRW